MLSLASSVRLIRCATTLKNSGRDFANKRVGMRTFVGGSAGFRAPIHDETSRRHFSGSRARKVRAESSRDQGESPRASVQQMTVRELESLMSDPDQIENTQFIDVREEWEHSTSSLPHFKLCPSSLLPQWGPVVVQELDSEVRTVVLCHHGIRSQYASEFLVSRGFENVFNIVGGIDAYSFINPSVPRY
ncbi:hypothetical protein BSKO_06259 [Bryopsis sp. KO-2023]|nr:hypothetical protein BSKO_06259 [Bryopsis sp. KO-2023]